MADYTGIFERVEQKYLLDSLQFEALWAVLEPYMRPDEYGRSTICNIYFDTPNYLLARLSGEKPVYKEKLRLRTYGVPKAESPSFVELKKKYQGIVYKRRIVMPYGEAYDWLVNGKAPKENSQIAKEIAWSLHYYGDLKSAMALCLLPENSVFKLFNVHIKFDFLHRRYIAVNQENDIIFIMKKWSSSYKGDSEYLGNVIPLYSGTELYIKREYIGMLEQQFGTLMMETCVEACTQTY